MGKIHLKSGETETLYLFYCGRCEQKYIFRNLEIGHEMTDNEEEVTCKHCLRALKARRHRDQNKD